MLDNPTKLCLQKFAEQIHLLKTSKFIYINTSTVSIISSTTWEREVSLGEGNNVFEIYGETENGKRTIDN